MKDWIQKLFGLFVILVVIAGIGMLYQFLKMKNSHGYYSTEDFIVIGTQAPGKKVVAESLETGARIEGEPATTLTNGQLVTVRYTYGPRPAHSNMLNDEIPAATNIVKTEFVPIDPHVVERHR